MNKQIIKYRTVLALSLVFLPKFVFSSQIILETDNSTVAPGDNISIGVYLDTDDKLVNAVEGKISLVSSGNFIRISDINDGNSSINFWINKPKITGNYIEYSGLTPAGILGTKRLLFNIELSGMSIGNSTLESKDTVVLLNDGKGSKVANIEDELVIKVVDKDSVVISEVNSDQINDIDPPESFTPIVATDKNIFDGENFIVFATQDKGSGLDHYEIKEGLFGSYHVVESPYLIKNQNLNKTIYVKAVDKKGNEIIQFVEADNNNFYRLIFIIGIIILILYLKYRKIHYAKYNKNNN